MTSATGNRLINSPEKAITFIELFVVIIILGILTAISWPQFRKAFSSMELNSISGQLQGFMNYLKERSVVEGKIIYLNIDSEKTEYWAVIRGEEDRLKTHHFPAAIAVEAEQKQIAFYPDGSIDKITVKLTNADNQSIILTTKGVFGAVKAKSQ